MVKHKLFHVYRQEAGEGGDPGGGGQTTDWKETLPESVREWDEVKNSDSPEKFFDQVSNMRSLMGQSIRIPSEEASEEDRNAFYSKLTEKVPGLMPTPDPTDEGSVESVLKALGRPDDAGQYSVPEIENNPLTDEKMGEMKAVAHKYGLTNKQFEGLMGDIIQSDVQMLNEMQAMSQKSRDEVRGEWGGTFEAREQNLIQFAEKSGAPNQLVELLKNGQTDGATLRWIHSMAESMGEKPVFTNNGKESTPTVDRAEASERAQELRTKLTHMPQSDPSYQSTLNRMMEYEKQASGG